MLFVSEILCLASIALLPFASEAARWLSVSALLPWLVSIAARNERPIIQDTRIGALYIGLALTAAFSLIGPPREWVLKEGWLWAARWAHYIGIFFMASDLFRDRDRRLRFLTLFQIVMIAVCLNGLHQMVFGRDLVKGYIAEVPGRAVRMRGAFVWPNSLGIFLLYALPVSFIVFLREGRWTLRGFAKLLVLALFSVCLLLTFSRAALIALAAAAAVTLIWRRHWQGSLLLAFAGCILYASSPLMRMNFFSSLTRWDITVGERVEFWKGAWGVFLDHPWTGAGVGFARFLQGQYAAVPRTDHAHNAYLQIAAEMGLAGFFLFLIPTWLLLRSAMKTRSEDPAFIGILTGTLSFFFAAFFESSFYYLQPALLFWFFWGWLCSEGVTRTRPAHA